MADSAPASQGPWRILIVDDERSVHLVLDRMFKRSGHPVTSVESGPAAMAVIDQPWDLFIIDKNLPEGNGIETALAARKRHPHAVIVMVTGFATSESAATLIGIADEYITKPFELDYLRATIEALMELRRMGREVGVLGGTPPSPSSPSPVPGPALGPGAFAPPPAPLGPPPGSGPSPLPRPSSPSGLGGPPSSGPSGLGALPASSPSGVGSARPSSPSSPSLTRPSSPSRPPSPGSSGASNRKLHIVLGDARDEATLLGAARLAGLHAISGPLPDDANPDVLILDGKSATFELRKAVWLRMARNPAFRVVMVMEATALGDSTAAVALKATIRLLRPVSAEAGADLMVKLKK